MTSTPAPPQFNHPEPVLMISITGNIPGSGKSSMTVILGQLLKEMGHTVAVAARTGIDADRIFDRIRNPKITPTLKPMQIILVDDPDGSPIQQQDEHK